jgi:hypothetical protein
MTTPIDKVFIRFSYYAEALLPLFAVLLAALGFVLGASVVIFILAAVFLFAVGAFVFAVTAPLWAMLGALVYTGLLVASLPFYNLHAVLRKTHKAS